jgi:hypothetical protein
MPEQYQPLEVLTARQIEDLAQAYTPGMSPAVVATVVKVAVELMKAHSIMIVKADPREYALHLRYLTKITWRP